MQILKYASFALTLVLFSCQANSQNVQKLAPQEFQSYLESHSDAQLIDVRTPGEVSGGYIDGATNIDYSSKSFQEEMSKLDKEKPVMVYCAAGGRSGNAATMLTDMGFKEVIDLKGGMGSWNQDKMKTVK